MRLHVLSSLLPLAAACATAGPPKDAGAFACATPTEIVLYNQNDIRSDCVDMDGNICDLVGIAVPQGAPTTLVIGAVDKDKQPCDPSLLQAGFVTGADFTAAGDADGNLVVTASKDAFDNGGIEPSDTLNVVYGDALAAHWQVMSAVNLAGDWEIAVDGLTVGDFGASQSGRFIRWDACAPNDTDPQCSSGIILGEQATLFSPIGSLELTGKIWSTRANLDGSWLDASTGDQGLWSATKIQSIQPPRM